MTLPSRSSENENEDDYNANVSLTQLALKTQTKWLCYFNDNWEDIYNWMGKVSNQNRSRCTLCIKELGVARGEESA